jgi:hypothetical protein
VQPPPQVGGQPKARAGGFAVTPVCCAGGVGVQLSYDDGSIRAVGTVTFMMAKPHAHFHLNISGGKVTDAELSVGGAAGFRVEIDAATTVGNTINLNKKFPIQIDFSVPIGQILGVPFAVTVNQWLVVKTAFSSKDGHIKATGEYSFGGSLGFGYSGGQFGPRVPEGFQTKESLTQSLAGVAIGASGIIVTYQAKFYVGIGAFGFSAGLYFGLTASVGLTLGSGAGAPLAVCRRVDVQLLANFGVGYTIPSPVADVINFFLRTFNTRPIQASGGIGSSTTVVNRSETVPDVQLCRA